MASVLCSQSKASTNCFHVFSTPFNQIDPKERNKKKRKESSFHQTWWIKLAGKPKNMSLALLLWNAFTSRAAHLTYMPWPIPKSNTLTDRICLNVVFSFQTFLHWPYTDTLPCHTKSNQNYNLLPLCVTSAWESPRRIQRAKGLEVNKCPAAAWASGREQSFSLNMNFYWLEVGATQRSRGLRLVNGVSSGKEDQPEISLKCISCFLGGVTEIYFLFAWNEAIYWCYAFFCFVFSQKAKGGMYYLARFPARGMYPAQLMKTVTSVIAELNKL